MKYFIFLIFLPISLFSQPAWNYTNEVYVDYIKSVKFHVDGLFLTMPIIDLGSQTPLVLSFDDLSGRTKNYSYKIVHCTRDWEPSNIPEMEYLDGFSEERITDFAFSYKTIVNYVHYKAFLPGPYFKWTKSGNYLLIVYEEGYNDRPIFTQRFMVVEPALRISSQMVRPAQASKMRTHQEIDFSVSYDNFPFRSPRQEVTATVIQNGRWDNAITDIPPLFERLNQLIFDYQNQIVFPGGKEFRPLDIRSLRFRNNRIEKIVEYFDRFEVILFPEKERNDQVFFNYRDLNGNFILENPDRNDADLAGNYVDVYFSLATPSSIPGKEVCVTGGFSNWKCYEENIMEYNETMGGYFGRLLLKQGYYDYAFALFEDPSSSESPDFTTLEGDWYETQNEYTILIYYRPFGGRFDRLIGASTFASGF